MASHAREKTDHHARLHQQFRWQVPKRFNIAEVCVERWSHTDRCALLYENQLGQRRAVKYRELHDDANRLANLLHSLGVNRGDRVAIVLPQCPQTVVAHMAIYRLGAIAMPLSILFGPEALEFRYADSQAVLSIVDGAQLEATRAARPDGLKHVLVVEGNDLELQVGDGELHWQASLAKASTQFDPHPTLADDPALLVYTSGTTGPPKGSLSAHRVLIGNLPGFVASQNWFPQREDVFWSPADWAWTGGLMDALLPSLYFGKTIVGYQGRFSAPKAFELIERYHVTNTFLFPTALKQMMRLDATPALSRHLRLRAIMCAGEALGETLFDWCREALGVEINEMFGQTEINYIVGNSAERWPVKPGSIGRPYPGHRVAVIDEDGQPVGVGIPGEIALARTDRHGVADPVFFSGYWRDPQATESKFSGEWCRTGDLASVDRDGYLWYQGRADDMFKAAGYRIGPGEIENCLLKHPAVANAAVVPKPDNERGNLVKAYVVLTAGYQANPGLTEQLQQHVRGKLAPYEYPKEIEFVEALPMTTTGKIQRGLLKVQEQERARQPS